MLAVGVKGIAMYAAIMRGTPDDPEDEPLSGIESNTSGLEADEESLATIEDELAVAKKRLEKAAGALAKARRANAPRLAEEVEEVLAALGLGRARFEVCFDERDGDDEARFGPHGTDDVAFLHVNQPFEVARAEPEHKRADQQSDCHAAKQDQPE